MGLDFHFAEQNSFRLSNQNMTNLSPEEGSEQIRQLYLASNLLPYRNITYTQRGRAYPAVEEVLHGSLKVNLTSERFVWQQHLRIFLTLVFPDQK